MTYAQIIKQYNGKPVDIDGAYGAQCYDWATLYMQLNWGLKGKPIMLWTGGARDYFEHYANLPTVTAVCDRVVNDPKNPNQLPKQGDVVIWSGSLPGSEGYGHIAVFDHISRPHFFVSYDQNWGGKFVHAQEHNWAYVLGWLTPKPKVAPPAPKPAPKPKVITPARPVTPAKPAPIVSPAKPPTIAPVKPPANPVVPPAPIVKTVVQPTGLGSFWLLFRNWLKRVFGI